MGHVHVYPVLAVYLISRGQLDDSLAVYTSAATLSKDQREVEHIALYEKGTLQLVNDAQGMTKRGSSLGES